MGVADIVEDDGEPDLARELTPPVAVMEEIAEAEPDSELVQLRAAVAGKIADVIVLSNGSVSANERSVAADLMLQLFTQIPEATRMQIAGRLSGVADCPPALLRAFLRDEPTVAEPLLTKCEGVPEALIIECAQKGSTAHRQMIAKRLHLSMATIDVIVPFRETEIAKNILRRDDVSLSPWAIEHLVTMSAGDPELQMLLLRRPEIEPAHGFLMFWWVRGERRKRIFSRFALERRVIQEALSEFYPKVFQDPNPDPVVKDILKLNDRRHKARGRDGQPLSMDSVKKILGLSYRRVSEDSIQAIALMADIRNETAERVLRDEGGEPYAVLCKAMGVPRDDFYNFLKASDQLEGAPPEGIEQLLEVFDSIARDFARAVLRYWDWKGNPRLHKINEQIGQDRVSA